MSQLIQVKQRIKAVQTIKKITQTMRLIAMSAHARCKKQADGIQRVAEALQQIKQFVPVLEASTGALESKKALYIFVASDKGLCGSFNTQLFSYIRAAHLNRADMDVITIGKKALRFAAEQHITPIRSFESFTAPKVASIADELYKMVVENYAQYESIVCISNMPRSFFVQEPTESVLKDAQDKAIDHYIPETDAYQWIEDRSEVGAFLFDFMLKTSIHSVLINSLVAEQAARFLSMDNASRSAEDMSKRMKLDFNKLRQAKITRELIELISGF